MSAATTPDPEPRPLGRRSFVASAGAAALGLALASLGRSRRAFAGGPWGELVEDPEGILDLPPGFSYAVLETKGQDMDDGYLVPGQPDGMACFVGPSGTLVLMRNHENLIGGSGGPYKTGQVPPPQAYQAEAMGGVTRLVIDASTYERISSNLVLIGTVRNCAGGPSPWGWLSCEESVGVYGVGPAASRHGYVFACPTDAQTVQTPDRIVAYGRFKHEAACVDPSNNHAYLTEDRGDSCLYRFVPDDMSQPFAGTLQALAIVGIDNYDTTTMQPDQLLAVTWVDIDDPDPETDSVRAQGQAKGAARIVRGEGIWFHEGQVFICSTSGGPVGKGQIFRLIDGDSPTLELIVRATEANGLDNPDNITVAPWGDVFMAEDGGPSQYIRWVDADRGICDFARNAGSTSEFAGVCFSPDGRAMFVNIQHDGLTLVITGPFPMMPDDGSGDSGGASGSDDGSSDGCPDAEAGAGFDAGDGCDCSTEAAKEPGTATAVSVAATLGLRALLSRSRPS